jgi:tryptophanyl-tRNA synthetase
MFSLTKRVPRRVPGCRFNHTPAKYAHPRVIFSGIQPTGVPHLGNFLGAILSWVNLQRTAKPDDQLYFCTVGWHALTLPQDPVQLRQNRRDMMAILIASGLDPARSVIFHQDEV